MKIISQKKRLSRSKLYVLLSNINEKRTILNIALEVLDGGADIIQLREKQLSDNELMSIAGDLQELTSKAKKLLIINDRVQIAKNIGADGVHLGQDDMNINDARKILGDKIIVGISTHNVKQALDAQNAGADYIAVGPIFPTKTKDYEPVAGIKFAQDVVKNINLPIFAIGGINQLNITRVLETGIFKVAISSAIIESPDITRATKEFKLMLQRIR